ncbi:hypothetical protein ACQPZP_23125 [Spirillospora sp. CA-142024]|uniref:hypothetical protein n=1 Tax=Spirillospora sp. CA-142024 TaxID=3240036 RepID=UPI003D8C8179
MYRTHEMHRVRTQESGLEEWACPTCGRRMLLRWPPDYLKQVVDPGDEKACHVGSAPDDLPGATKDDRMRLHTARRWLRETGVDTVSSPGHARLNPPEPV